MAFLDVRHLTKEFIAERDFFGRAKKTVTAVCDLSLTIEAGETVGLVGESGCGKSTFARTVLDLYPKTAGEIFCDGVRRESMGEAAFRRKIQMIFQDPYASLDPRLTIGESIAEPLRNYGLYPTGEERERRIAALLEQVDMPREAAQRYPYEFSGGQRQRVGIARALALEPACIFCDEPISALDVSVQVQIVNMLQRLQQEKGLAYLFIAHDLAMVHHLSHRIGVMYLGRLVELGTSDAVYKTPMHPYTQLLLSSMAKADPRQTRRVVPVGEVPSPFAVPEGCVFHPRCTAATARCRCEIPSWREVGAGHFAACHFAGRGRS